MPLPSLPHQQALQARPLTPSRERCDRGCVHSEPEGKRWIAGAYKQARIRCALIGLRGSLDALGPNGGTGGNAAGAARPGSPKGDIKARLRSQSWRIHCAHMLGCELRIIAGMMRQGHCPPGPRREDVARWRIPSESIVPNPSLALAL